MSGGCAFGLYHGLVRHRRLRPTPHHFTYRVFSVLLDLDRLAARAKKCRLFSFNRFNLFSFHERDHGDGKGALRGWVDAQCVKAGVRRPARIRLLCYPRLLGYVFNPLSVYFCYDEDKRLQAVLYEVHNTFGDRHCYLFVLDGSGPARQILRHNCAKEFYVSPFINMQMHYHFRCTEPGEKVAIAIHETDAQGDFLHAGFSGRYRPFTDRTLLQAWIRHPLMTVKVIAGIHYEALRLWQKGVKFHKRPNPPEQMLRIHYVSTSNKTRYRKDSPLHV